jgi:hypothetical protein
MMGDANDGPPFQKFTLEKVIDDELCSMQVEGGKDVIQKYDLCRRVYRSSQADSSFLAATDKTMKSIPGMPLKADNLTWR